EVNTPSVRSTPFDDVHLSLVQRPNAESGAIELQVTVQPLVVWLWVGGGLMLVGSFLALFPGGRRRPTDPVSVVRAEHGPAGEPDDGDGGAGSRPGPGDPGVPAGDAEPVGAR